MIRGEDDSLFEFKAAAWTPAGAAHPELLENMRRRSTTCRYFAYGSNLSTQRLRERAPSARAIGRARLPRHRLRWHKLGRDGSGKCFVECTGVAADDVWGVLFELDWRDKPKLDAAEGLGIGYFEREVRLAMDGGERLALTYYAKPDKIDPALRPRQWYKNHVLRGAREHGLPASYIAALERVEADS